MAPKRPFDKVDEESQEPPQVKRRRIRRSGAHLHQDVGEESPVLSKNKISFRGPGGRSSIELPEVPGDFKQKSFATIHEVLAVVLSNGWFSQKTPLPLPEEKIYRVVRHLCDLNMDDFLYDAIRQQCTQHIEAQVRRSFDLPSPGESLQFLRGILYHDIYDQSYIIGKLALYLNQTYSYRRNALPLFKMVMEIRRVTIENEGHRIVDWIWIIITQHRKGDNQEHVLRFAVEPLLTMVREFNVFLYIETQLFERTRKCYADEADRIVELQEVGQDCIKQVAKRCDEELNLVAFFEQINREELKEILAEQLVKRVVDKSERAFKNCVENENKPLLRSMYDMVKKVNRIGSLRDLLLEYTKNKGNQILTVENTNSYGHLQYLALMYERSNSSYEQRHKANVGDLIRLRFRLESICEECFENDASLLGAVSDGYRIFMSGGTREALYARLSAEYLDDFLRSSPNSATFESQVNVVVKMLKNNEQMLLFVENYAYYLGKRLLFPPSVSDYSIERETFIISKLKELRSPEIISIDRMLRDITSRSPVLNATFIEKQLNIPLYISEVVITVLSQTEWPEFKMSSGSNIAIPKEIAKYEEHFQAFYTEDGLKDLHWPDHLGTWTLKAHFAGGEKEIHGTKLQVTILMQFNEADKLSLEEITERTGISNPTKILESLVNQNILIKEKNGDSVSYAINDGFSSEHYKITVTDVVYEDLLKEKQPSKLPPLQRYKKQVQAAIVHLMKTSKDKAYKTEELFQLIEAIKVRPDFAMSDFKACIEGLINSKHIRKSAEDPEILEYIP